MDTPIVRAETWIKQHERILIIAMVLAVGAFGFNRYVDVSAARADAKYAAAQQQVADAKANTAAALLQASTTAAQYQAMVDAITKQNAALVQAVAQRNTVLVQQQTAIKTAPLSDVASTWHAQIGTGSVVSDTKGITVDEPAARATVSQLLELPVVKANLTDETKIADNYLSELQKSDLLANNLNTEIAALNTQLVTDANACTLQVAAVKADARKGKVKWFKIGFVTGFVAGLWSGHAAGL